jgi:hypothetical protein
MWLLNRVNEELNIFEIFEGISSSFPNKLKGRIQRIGCETVDEIFSIMETIQEGHQSLKDIIEAFFENYIFVQAPAILIIHLKRTQWAGKET